MNLTEDQQIALNAAKFADMGSIIGNERKVRLAKVSHYNTLRQLITNDRCGEMVVELSPSAFAYFCQIKG